MTAAKKEFSDRRFNINRMTPNVNQDSEMHIFFNDPTDSIDPYPDRLIKFGTRGGLVVESC